MHVVPKLSFLKIFLAGSLLAGVVVQATEPPSKAAVFSAGMDTSVQPGDDFYAYANGNWLKATSIPADKSSFGAFAQLRDITQKRVAELIRQTAATGPTAGG